MPVDRDGGRWPTRSDRDRSPDVLPAKVRAPIADALARERLEAILAGAFDRRFGLVVAPAGSGKTTLLARFAATSGVPVAWYRADALDRDEAALVRHLEAALLGALPALRGGWAGVDDLVRAVEARNPGRVLLVVDDFHALEGSAAEAAFGRLVDYAPASLAIVVAGRVTPGLNLSRMRVAGELLEVGPDDLRFRAWEVEQLYRDVYRDPVPPGILADLTRRTEGWAAGLQLFHLASAGKPAEERRRLLTAVGSQGRMVREYLTRNVLAELPPELRSFLRETCVLGRLSGPLCDRLLGTTGSVTMLEELVRRGVFTVPVEDADGVYRYHEVLRSYLDRLLVLDLGEEEARSRHARAASLLEAEGALTEAVSAWSRAEDWAAVDRLLRGRGERVVASGHGWVEGLPPALVRHEPWLMLAAARQARGDGRWAAALDWYVRAEAGFGAASAGVICRQERTVLAAWLDPATPMPLHWTAALRAGLTRDPATAARDQQAPDGEHRALVRGLLWLAAGNLSEAKRWLRAARETPDLDATLDAAATLALAAAQLMADEPGALAAVTGAVELAERAGAGWLATVGRRLAQGRAHVSPAADRAATPTEGGPDVAEDPWGRAMGDLARAWFSGDRDGAGSAVGDDGELPGPADGRAGTAEAAAAAFRRLGSGVLEAWARALAALGGADADPDSAREAALGAEALARSAGALGARLPAYRALELADPARASDYAQLADSVEAETGLVLPAARASDQRAATHPTRGPAGRHVGIAVGPGATVAAAGADRVDGIRITTLGGFAIMVDGVPLDLSSLKPRARLLLHLLVIQAPAAVHREVLQEALWPDADPATGARSLQVGVSAIRGVLAPAGGSLALAREGDAYRLVMPDDAIDLRRLERSMAATRDAEVRGEPVVERYLALVERLGVELLPEDGPAEWIVQRREQLRAAGVSAAEAAARAALASGAHEAAVRACQSGLALDRYHDPLWRLLIETHDRAGDAGAASRDRRHYEAVLAGLGVAAERQPLA